ncbi:MAG: T9SS type A sorting domain-containing protein [Bacteroidales bacterium]|nr:T9SS type A sorting domain-containing protein [Bacteroidales bacterium]
MIQNYYKSGSLIRFFIVLVLLFAAALSGNYSASAQTIYEPEGLNMPGAWNGWTNPPVNNLVLASYTQVSGGELTKISTGTTRWQTIFSVGTSGADLTGGSYEWLFTSGSWGGPWGNKWAGVNVSMNSLQDYTFNGGANNTITITDGKWYTMNWKDSGYNGTQAIFMETSAEPVLLSSLSVPSNVPASQSADIILTTSATPAAEELFYLRYSADNWATSGITSFTMSGNSGTATIPGQTAGATVKYYAFSSTVSSITSNFDLYTIRSSSSYSYMVNGLSTEAEILSFSLPEQTGAAAINSLAATVNIQVSYGTSLTALTPTIGVSTAASINPASGVTRDFTSALTYTVTSEASTQKVWTVTVTVASPPAFDWANVQWPPNGSIQPGEEFFVYAQAYEGGVTPGSGQGSGVQAWIGYSTDNTNPNTWTNWIVAPYFGESGNNDEFRLNLGAEIGTTGTYYYASRFQLGTAPFQYGGFNGGFWDGSSNVSGVLTVSYPATSNWTGAVSGEWTNSGNWDNGVPGSTTDVTIPVGVTNYPVLTALNSGSCHNILIQSNASGTGSILGNEYLTVSGTATAERYIAGWGDASHGWHHLSSPVASQAIQPGFVSDPPVDGEDFYSWGEDINTWINSKQTSGAWNPAFENNFVSGKGYLVAYQNNITKSFSGVLTSGDVNLSSLTNNVSSTNHGWNLLGNPFASAVKWNDGSWQLTNVAGIAKIWDEVSASYGDITANGIIPAMNGFMVQVTSPNTSGSLTIPSSSRVHSATPWFKSSGNEIILIARDMENNTAQKSIIMANDFATENFDNDFDSHFLAGFAPKFYSVQGNDMLSTNTLPDISDSRTIDLGFVKNEASEFSISLNPENLPLNLSVVLTDKKTGIVTDLTKTDLYSFTSEEGDASDRFALNFKSTSAINELKAGEYSIFASPGFLNISSQQPLTGLVTVSDITGRNIASESMNSSTSLQIPVAQTGIYIVSIRSTQGIANQKVVVR